MRRMWTAGAAIVVCLALGGAPMSAAELPESTGMPGSIWQPETGTSTFVIVHPDGTMVVQHAFWGIGLGILGTDRRWLAVESRRLHLRVRG